MKEFSLSEDDVITVQRSRLDPTKSDVKSVLLSNINSSTEKIDQKHSKQLPIAVRLPNKDKP